MMRKVIKIDPVAIKLPVKKRVAAYARVSSGKDAMLHSLSAQISHYSETIQSRLDWQYAGVYADEAATGTKDNRAEFQKMLTDCRNKKIDLIITKSISRFARNTVTLLEVVRELSSLNIEVYFEKENIYSLSGDGELMLTILASFAQAESLSVSENCKWRIRKGFLEGELVNLRFMYGYRISRGLIEIDEEQAQIVRMIFDDYLGGMGCTQIAKKLRELNVKRIRDGIWTAERVGEILKNEKYAGNSLAQKKYVSDHLTKKLITNWGQLPKYYAENTHPAIIDQETFDKAQVLLASKRKTSGKKEKAVYAFTEKIVCDKCGKHYNRKATHGYVYWNCRTFLHFGKSVCHTKQIPEVILMQVSAEVLGLDPFDEEIFHQQIKEIRVPDDFKLKFVFHNGDTVEKGWHNKSRKDSWDEKKRQEARKRQSLIMERGLAN
ncbi:MAG: resolvase [Acetobacterium sp. MES1]|uniref:recombinase family protein n=1 Tax=Acetobacterium sp. MES1 TaxID=1899015 RepID=UPI000B9D1D06|nr:recombinase family protein [Acetobacterium sp. MES1]OXS26192.1 MAG: resolvase [Acetobacterium sp. MES1]